MGKQWLKNLMIDRVDLVDEGDNPQAWVSIFKRKNSDGGESEKKEERVIEKFMKGLEGLVSKLKGDDSVPTFEEMLKGLSEDQQTAIKKAVEAQVVKELEDTKKSEEEEAKKKEEADEAEAKKKEEEEEAKKEEDEEEEEMMKKLPENVRKIIEKSNARVAAAEKVTKQLQDEAENQVYVIKAKQFDRLAVTADELGPILKQAAGAGKDALGKLEAVLKAANEAASRGDALEEEIGKGGTTGSGGDSWAKIEAAADELVVKSGAEMTKEQAITKIIKMKPSLYRDHLKEMEV